MKIGILEILVIICVLLSLVAGVCVLLFGAMLMPNLYTQEYVQAQGTKLVEPWAWAGAGVAFAGILFSIYGWITVKSLAEFVGEKNLGKDERVKMLHYRGIVMAYGIFMLVLITVALYELLTDGPAKDITYGLVFFSIILNGLCIGVSRYVLG